MKLLTKPKTSLNLKSLDALRGILAIYVLLGHARWLLWIGNSEWNQSNHAWWSNLLVLASSVFRYGHEVVMIFFVLSGFFIHLRISKQLANNEKISFDIVNFFKRRSHRLIPPYIFALLLTVVVDLIGMSLYPTLYNASTGDALLDGNFARKGFSLVSIVSALFLLPSSLGQDFGSNGPFWSLSYEIVYYLMYPLWLALRRFGAWQGYLGGTALGVGAILFLEPSFFSSAVGHYPIWLIGAFIAERLTKKQLKNSEVTVALILGSMSFVTMHLSMPLIIKLGLYGIFGASVLLACVGLPISLSKDKWHYWCEFLGQESYTIYICHFPIMTLMSAWSIEKFGNRPMDGWLALGGTIITYFICHICFLLCEKKFLHRRLKA